MELLASLFVARPLNILAVAALFLTGYLALRSTTLGAGRHPRRLLFPAALWLSRQTQCVQGGSERLRV